tara:strand:- start:131 stop:340 length:210 start_codon:yes stop_codon:yes gene_type:complete
MLFLVVGIEKGSAQPKAYSVHLKKTEANAEIHGVYKWLPANKGVAFKIVEAEDVESLPTLPSAARAART